MNKLTWFELLEAYAGRARVRSTYENDSVDRNLGMGAVARKLVVRRASKEEVVTTLRDEAGKRGALQRIYEPADNTWPFAQGMTHQDIIDMIEQAPEQTE